METKPGAAATAEQRLAKEIGVRALAATTFNIIIGGGIFGVPATAASGLGAAAPIAYLVCAAAMGLIVLCMAEAGSRISLSGGPYAYVGQALGGYVGFLAGALLWLVATFATAAVATIFASSLAVFWPLLRFDVLQDLILIALFATLGAVNVLGVRQGTRLIEGVTIVKLLPLVLFVIVGAAYVEPSNLGWTDSPTASAIGRTSIMLFFAFAGIESALVPSGEVRDPARTVPRALFIAMVGVTVLYIAIQLVAQGIMGSSLGRQTQPLAAAATLAIGPAGGMVLAIAAAISTLGHASGMTLATPRALFAFGRDGILPAAFSKVHPRYRTPHVAIIAQSAAAALFAVTSSFARLAILATVATLVLYLLCCVAAWELRRRDVRTAGSPLRLPGGPLVHVSAIAVIVWLLSSAHLREFAVVGGVIVAATIAYLLSMAWRKRLAVQS